MYKEAFIPSVWNVAEALGLGDPGLEQAIQAVRDAQ